jgi:hypothetical protein
VNSDSVTYSASGHAVSAETPETLSTLAIPDQVAELSRTRFIFAVNRGSFTGFPGLGSLPGVALIFPDLPRCFPADVGNSIGAQHWRISWETHQ